MDGLRAGVIFVDAEGKLLHANAAAQGILNQANIARRVARALTS
jgi:hypothetical protein